MAIYGRKVRGVKSTGRWQSVAPFMRVRGPGLLLFPAALHTQEGGGRFSARKYNNAFKISNTLHRRRVAGGIREMQFRDPLACAIQAPLRRLMSRCHIVLPISCGVLQNTKYQIQNTKYKIPNCRFNFMPLFKPAFESSNPSLVTNVLFMILLENQICVIFLLLGQLIQVGENFLPCFCFQSSSLTLSLLHLL